MGIRPRKSIGWGMKVKGSELSEAAVEGVFSKESLSFSGLIDYIIEKDLMKKNREYRDDDLNRERYEKLDEKNKIFKYLDIIDENYDNDGDFNESEYYVLFYPNILSALTIGNFPDGKEYVDEWKSGDDAFVYAELENFFPESMDTLKSVAYNFKSAPFPSDYSIVEKNEVNNVSNFKPASRDYFEIKRALLNMDNSDKDLLSLVAGFKNFEELESKYTLAPPEDVFSFAQYSQIFKSESTAFELKPMVVYRWV